MDNAASGTLSTVGSCEEAAPPALLLRLLHGSPVNRKCFISPLTHPAVGTSGGQRSLTPPGTPSSLLPLWAHVASAVLLLGWFLQESFSTPRGQLLSAGQDHNPEDASLDPSLVRHLCCGDYRRISWYSWLSLSSVDLSPVVRGMHLQAPLPCPIP